MRKRVLFLCISLALSMVLSVPAGEISCAPPRGAGYVQHHKQEKAPVKKAPAKSVENKSSLSKEQLNKISAISSVFRYYNRNLPKRDADNYAKFTLEAAERYKIDPGLLAGLIIKESTVRPNARSKYAVGLMQIYWRMHKKAIMAQFPHVKTEKDVMEPRTNIFVGTWLYAKYLKDCKGNERAALSRYLGKKNAGRYIAQINSYRKRYREYLKSGSPK